MPKQEVLLAERRRLDLYNRRNRVPSNNLMMQKVLAAGLVVTTTTRATDMARKSGHAVVDMNNFEEKLFLTCGE